MGKSGRTRRQLLAAVLALAVVPLVLASGAFACQPLAVVQVEPSSGAPGTTVRLVGTGFLHHEDSAGPIQIWWDRSGGHLIRSVPASAIDPETRTISLDITIPISATLGDHTIVVTQRDPAGTLYAGFPGRARFHVDALAPKPVGYRLLGSDGGVFAFGDAPFLGSLGGARLNAPVVAGAATASGGGYWMVASDGGVFAFGDAAFRGSLGGASPAAPVVGMAPTATGQGYWLVTSGGAAHPFGDASAVGPPTGLATAAPVVGVAAAAGTGYWMVGSDGGVFAFGDAPYRGSVGGTPLVRPVVGMAAAPSGQGYWLVASDGGVFAFGDGPFLGSTGDLRLNRPIVAVAA